MATRKARSPLAGIRKLLLAVLVLVVLGIAGLFLFGKAGQRREKPARAEEEDTRGAKGMTLIGEDFDYTFTEGAPSLAARSKSSMPSCSPSSQ